MAARSPRPTSKAPKATEQELTSRVKELEDSTKTMERSQKLAERKRTQELREAKKKISRELQAAQRSLTRSEHEASKLAGQLTRTEHQAQQATARKVRETDRLEDGVIRIRQKNKKVGSALRDKMAAVGQARGRLAHVQMAMSLLEEKGVIVSTEALETSYREARQAEAGQDFGGQTEKDLHDGDTGERDDLISKLRDGYDQLQEENVSLREHLSQADRRCSAAIRLLAEAQAVLEKKSSTLQDTAGTSQTTCSSTAKDDSEALDASRISILSRTDFTQTASTQPALPATMSPRSFPRSYTPRPLPTLLATSTPMSKAYVAGPVRMTSCPLASPLQRYRVIQDKQPAFTSVPMGTNSFMEPTALKSPQMILRREPVAMNRVQSEQQVLMAWP